MNLTLDERYRIRLLRHEGWSIGRIVEETGRSEAAIHKVIAAAGGLPPRDRSVRAGCLTLADREEISRGLSVGEAFAVLGRRLGFATSTISREVGGVAGRATYRAWVGERRAHERARRPKTAKLALDATLRAEVEAMLEARWSPRQIAHRLRVEHPESPEMWVSHETIYQSLYVQGRGALRRELAACLRSGRTRRKAHKATGRGQAGVLRDMVMISERPPEVEDRAVPGHWEGDLIIGKNNKSAIGTLVERSTRFVLLLHLPAGGTASHVREAMAAKIAELPAHLRRSITWDQGKEMAQHAQFTVDTSVQIYFCDPHSPWQRGSNENTNGLLRQYFPKGTDLAVHDAAHLDAVAAELNGRPRQTLDWLKPSEKLNELLVAATG